MLFSCRKITKSSVRHTTLRTLTHWRVVNYVEMLKEKVKQPTGVQQCGRRWTFQHDSDPSYKAKATQEWLQNRTVNIQELPSYSPDLSPVATWQSWSSFAWKNEKIWAARCPKLIETYCIPTQKSLNWSMRSAPRSWLNIFVTSNLSNQFFVICFHDTDMKASLLVISAQRIIHSTIIWSFKNSKTFNKPQRGDFFLWEL